MRILQYKYSIKPTIDLTWPIYQKLLAESVEVPLNVGFTTFGIEAILG